jgi:hypothetical protein
MKKLVAPLHTFKGLYNYTTFSLSQTGEIGSIKEDRYYSDHIYVSLSAYIYTHSISLTQNRFERIAVIRFISI